MRYKIEKILFKLFSNKQLNTFVLCLVLSSSLWISITFSKEYIYSEAFPISFIDSGNNVNFQSKDSVLTIEIRTNGFRYLTNHFKLTKQDKIIVDIDDLNIDLSRGSNKIPVSRLKPTITNAIGLDRNDVKISPEYIDLRWHKIYHKRVPVVNLASFGFKKHYDAYYPPEPMVKSVLIEGNLQDLQKTDTLYTKRVKFNNIDKNTTVFAPIDLSSLPSQVSCMSTLIPIRVSCEKYTENVISVPVNVVRYEDYKNIKILPREVKVRYRVAMRDYHKVFSKDFNAYVMCSNKNIENRSKLEVMLSDTPSFIHIVNTDPVSVNFILFK